MKPDKYVYYEVSEEWEDKPFFHREISIWIKEDPPKDYRPPYLGSPNIKLEYQKGTYNNENDEIAEKQKSRYYYEGIREIRTEGWVDSEDLQIITDLFSKIERKMKSLAKKGLTLNVDDDLFKIRLAQLKLIGGIEVYYYKGEYYIKS